VAPPALGPAQVGLRDFLSTPPGGGQQVGQVHTLTSSRLGASYVDQMFADLGRQGLRGTTTQAPGLWIVPPTTTTTRQDMELVKNEATKLVQQKIVNELHLRRIVDTTVTFHQDQNQISVVFKVAYQSIHAGVPMPENMDAHGTIALNFSPMWYGNQKVYKIHSPSQANFDRGDAAQLWRKIAPAMDRICADRITTSNRFDEQAFTNNVLRQAEKLYGVSEGTFQLNKVERIDGGFMFIIYTDHNEYNPRSDYNEYNPDSTKRVGPDRLGRGELWLTFKYDEAQVRSGAVQLTEVRQGFWFQQYYWSSRTGGAWRQEWHDLTGREHFVPFKYDTAAVHQQLKAAKWWLGEDRDAQLTKELIAGGNEFVKKLQEALSNKSTNPNFVGTGDLITGNPVIERTADGLRVTVQVSREGEMGGEHPDRGVQYNLRATVTFNLTYVGRVNGVDQFTCTLAGSNVEHLTSHVRPGVADLASFGTSDAALRSQFTSFSHRVAQG
jgi:hypothetical protein